jgi:tetratricopeptide (TPR) repeat protein
VTGVQTCALPIWFNLAEESNVPTWFHEVLLFAVALCALALHRAQEPGTDRRCVPQLFWLLFGAAYLFLSADEAARIHELISWYFGLPGFLVYGGLGGAFIALCVYYFFVVRKDAPHLRRWILPGLFLLIMGAFGFELINLQVLASKFPELSRVEVILVEGAEMLGTILVLAGCLKEISLQPSSSLMGVLQRKRTRVACLRRGLAFGLALLSALALVGYAYLRLGSDKHIGTPMLSYRYDEAMKARRYERALQVVSVQVERATGRKRIKEAHKLLAEKIRLETMLGRPEEALQTLNSKRIPPRLTPKVTLDLALALRSHGNANEAAILLEGLRSQNPEHRLAWQVDLHLARISREARRWPDAERFCLEAMDRSAKHPSLHARAEVELARVYRAQGELARACEVLDRLPDRWLDLDFFFRVKGELMTRLAAQGKLREALALAADAAARLKDRPDLLGPVLERLKSFPKTTGK